LSFNGIDIHQFSMRAICVSWAFCLSSLCLFNPLLNFISVVTAPPLELVKEPIGKVATDRNEPTWVKHSFGCIKLY